MMIIIFFYLAQGHVFTCAHLFFFSCWLVCHCDCTEATESISMKLDWQIGIGHE